MRNREYGQFCGLARAAEVLGQRWTLLILRDLLVGPRRYSDLAAGLPGIPSNLLSTRLKELEQDGLVVREARSGADRSIVYAITGRGAELQPALDALSRWGAAEMREPREGEIVTEASLVSALRVAAVGAASAGRPLIFTVRVGDAAAHAIVKDGRADVGAGEHPAADLVITGGPGFRDLLAGVVDPATAIAENAVLVEGDPRLLADFVSIFTVPYGGTAPGELRR
ncbi:winged helix-turn-helix transcriptional regulator [Microbacterium sp. No. 7]|uniref:winged helix-turn-helix transcriptional regulator n=1 Tax=Microbacterium sp. No. 7 TaxID=1714373 RepID=UPI0006D21BE9|nr:winged helix-turn-helix transcriptional regulator [Microbacterium sp. No. 7]ALJ19701.1 HxlR family transcriptional regulator [Microbacterium sp. No. 7]